MASFSSPSDSSTSTEQPPAGPGRSSTEKSKTGEYLEKLSQQIMEINLNDKDCLNPLIIKHMSPQFRATHDALPRVATREDHQANLQKHIERQGANFGVHILNTSSEVDDSRGRATVYVWYELAGLENGLGREAVAVLSWERRQGLWQQIKHTGMRGPSGFW